MLLFRLLIAGLALVPLGLLVRGVLQGALGPDPGEVVTESLGLAAFQLLLATLAMTPLRRITGWPGWLRVRRQLGLFCFFYASLHLLAFLQFVVGWQDLTASFTKRPYILAGLVAFIILLPLALTSTRGMMRRLGKRWKRLHSGVYLAAVAAWVHFLWQARGDIGEMLAYGVILAVLLGLRLWWSAAVQKRLARPDRA
ncbi:MAG: protein-methionine-sulfoxide reductase heme-binding subunit MsrQ [Marinobacter sp.]|uniref:sulfite oxidase heme-binding subunit YedZ n=1 Tax=Marinobacter sp. TaxID=50741 RepID=UPI00299D708D|nr:protein-methionine-sulfoxide reductase heme-binding subunit MsrQ [Marinobacter sp.]MDX1634659.1 protein-methionine-sulfoxide reductase heme-binding subunit MsrQ [Marinobacter sp.]